MIVFEDVQHFLLRVLTGRPADTLSQGGRGIVGDNAEAEFQRREAALAVVAGFLQRLVKTTLQLDAAEQGGDAAANRAFRVFARVVLAVALRVFGSVLGMARLDVVEGRLNDQTAALIQEQAEAVLEVKSGSGGDGCTEKPDGEGGDLLAHAKAGLGSFGENGLKFLKNRSSQGDGQNARLNHGGCLSREGKRDRGPGTCNLLSRERCLFLPLPLPRKRTQRPPNRKTRPFFPCFARKEELHPF